MSQIRGKDIISNMGKILTKLGWSMKSQQEQAGNGQKKSSKEVEKKEGE